MGQARHQESQAIIQLGLICKANGIEHRLTNRTTLGPTDKAGPGGGRGRADEPDHQGSDRQTLPL